MNRYIAPSTDLPMTDHESSFEVCANCRNLIHVDEANCPTCGIFPGRENHDVAGELNVFLTDESRQKAMRVLMTSLWGIGIELLLTICSGALFRITEAIIFMYFFIAGIFSMFATGALLWQCYDFINSGKSSFPLTLFLDADSLPTKRFYPASFGETLSLIEEDVAANEKLLTEISGLRETASNQSNLESLDTALAVVRKQQAVLNFNRSLVKAQILSREVETFARHDYQLMNVADAASRIKEMQGEIRQVRAVAVEANNILEIEPEKRDTIFTQISDLEGNLRTLAELVETRATAAVLAKVKDTGLSGGVAEDYSTLSLTGIQSAVESYEFIRCLIEDEREFEKMRIEAVELLKTNDAA
jgi:hypothetical protein